MCRLDLQCFGIGLDKLLSVLHNVAPKGSSTRSQPADCMIEGMAG